MTEIYSESEEEWQFCKFEQYALMQWKNNTKSLRKMAAEKQYENTTIPYTMSSEEQYGEDLFKMKLQEDVIKKVDAGNQHQSQILMSIGAGVVPQPKMKLHQDLSYLGFEIEMPSRSPIHHVDEKTSSLIFNHTTPTPNLSSQSKPSTMESWVRRSLSLRNFRRSSKKLHHGFETSLLGDLKLRDNISVTNGSPTKQYRRFNDQLDESLTPSIKEDSVASHRRRASTIRVIYELEDGAIDLEETYSMDGKRNSWTSEMTTLNVLPSLSFGAPEKSATEDHVPTSWTSALTTFNVSRLPSRDPESSIPEYEARISWNSEITRISTPELTPESHRSHKSSHKRSFSSEDTIQTPELKPKPLEFRRLQNNPKIYGVTGAISEVSADRDGLMPKPLTIRKVTHARVSSSSYSNATLKQSDDEESSYDPTSPEAASETDRVKFYRSFYNNRPLMRCLDMADDNYLASNLYSRLLEETRHLDDFRGELKVREFWDDTRGKLQTDHDDKMISCFPTEHETRKARIHDTIDNILQQYGPDVSPRDPGIVPASAWCEPWTSR